VPSAVIKAGLKVTLCDIDPLTFDFDHRLLEKVISEKTLCVVPDHLFGIPADMDKIVALSKGKGVFVVEDAAQAMGGKYRDKLLGTLGDVGFFSLGRGKNLTCGLGGIIITNSDSIAKKVGEAYELLMYPSQIENLKEFLKASLLAFFIRPYAYWLPSGLSFLRLGETFFYRDFSIKRLSGMQAGLLANWQLRLEKMNEIRRQHSSEFNGVRGLDGFSAQIPYLRLPIITRTQEARDMLLQDFKVFGLSCMYPVPANEIEDIKHMFTGKSYPQAKSVAERILTIPTHGLLSKKDRKKIAQIFRQATY
jgi:dTDP-4-amino-4,6-dideoxygalactose transaminase